MKIIIEDILGKTIRDLVTINIDILLSRIDSKTLDDEDYDMIKSHLEFYKDLLIEADINGKND